MAILRRTLSLVLGLLSIAVSLGFSDFIFDEKYLMGSMLLGLSFLIAYLSYVVSPSKSVLRTFGPLLIIIGLFQLASNFYFKTTANEWGISELMYYSVVVLNVVVTLIGIIACFKAPKLDKPLSTRRPMRIDFFFWSKILGAIIVLSIGVLSAINGKVSISLVMVLMVAYSVSVFSLYLMMKGNKKGRIIYTVFLGVGILNSLGVSPENFKLIAFASALLSMVCITIFHTKKMNLYFERAKTNRFEFFNGLMING